MQVVYILRLEVTQNFDAFWLGLERAVCCGNDSQFRGNHEQHWTKAMQITITGADVMIIAHN